MDKIEKYIKALCKDLYVDPAEAKEFREEVRTHILETVRELRLQGKSEEESIETALKRFGNNKQLNIEFRKVFSFQKKFKKVLFFISTSFLILSVAFLAILLFVDHKNGSAFDGMQHDFLGQIGSRITAGEQISSEDIGKIFNKYRREFRYIYIRQIDNGISDGNANPGTNSDSIEYLYPSDTPRKELGNQAYFTYNFTSQKDNTKWEAEIAYKSEVIFTPLINILLVISIICFTIYWILFGAWGVIYAFHMNRLSVIWGVSFFLFNIFAYLLFVMGGKLKIKKLYSV